MFQVTNKGFKSNQIAALMILAAHLATGALEARHFSAGSVESAAIANQAIVSQHIANGALDQTAFFADGVITEAKLDVQTQTKLNKSLALATANRAPGADDDGVGTADQTGVTWKQGSAAMLHAKWVHDKGNGEKDIYVCLNADTGAAEWEDVSNLEIDDLGDLAVMDKSQLEQTITIESSRVSDLEDLATTSKATLESTINITSDRVTDLEDLATTSKATLESTISIVAARVSDFTGAVQAVGDARYASLTANNRLEGNQIFQANITVGGQANLGSNIFLAGRPVSSMLLSGDASSTLDTAMVSAGYVAKEIAAAVQASEIFEEKIKVTTVGATEIVYSGTGAEQSVDFYRNGGFFDEVTHDETNTKYTFAALQANEEIVMVRRTKGA